MYGILRKVLDEQLVEWELISLHKGLDVLEDTNTSLVIHLALCR